MRLFSVLRHILANKRPIRYILVVCSRIFFMFGHAGRKDTLGDRDYVPGYRDVCKPSFSVFRWN